MKTHSRDGKVTTRVSPAASRDGDARVMTRGATTAVSARGDARGTRDGETDDDARCAVTRATQAW